MHVAGTAARDVTTMAARAEERRHAFQRLSEAHLDRSYRLARLILGSGADAEDAVHDAFLRAWRAWPSLRDESRFEPWFGRILINTCRDRLRRAARTRTAELPPDLPSGDAIGTAGERDLLQRALARLRPDDQVVLALRFHRDLRVEQVATILGIAPGTVMSRQHRAIARLRAILAESGEGGARR